MGKLTGVIANKENVEKTVHKSEWISQITMVTLVILAVITLPMVSDFVVSAYIGDAFSVFGYQMLYYMYQYGLLGSPLSMDCIFVCVVSLVLIAIVLFVGIGKKGKQKTASIYLAGTLLNDSARTYKGSMNIETEATAKNWYLESIFGEDRLAPVGSVLNIILFVLAGVASVLLMTGVVPVVA